MNPVFSDINQTSRLFRMVFDFKKKTEGCSDRIRIIETYAYRLSFIISVEISFENIPDGFIDILIHRSEDRLENHVQFEFRFDMYGLNYRDWLHINSLFAQKRMCYFNKKNPSLF